MSGLAAAEAYRLWAPSYSEETVVSFLENELVSEMTPALGRRRLLDVGCGTGRRIRGTGASTVVGLEACGEMLAAGIEADGTFEEAELVVGDIRRMPLKSSAFDVIWCRLVLGHLPQINDAYAELARVAQVGATIIVSDFHPEAVAAGHRRSFRLGNQVIEVEHHVHRPEAHVAAAEAAGLDLDYIREAEIGDSARPFYQSANRLGVFSKQVGLPLVLALAFRKAC